MPIQFNETYEPRPWRCNECQRILGVVMRDMNRIRRVWVFWKDRAENDMPCAAGLWNVVIAGH